jgi:hypothetical protein
MSLVKGLRNMDCVTSDHLTPQLTTGPLLDKDTRLHELTVAINTMGSCVIHHTNP